MSRSAEAPLLLDTASVLLPDRNETLFLKACLGVETGRSWQDWRAGQPVLRNAIAGLPACKRLLPLLFFTLTHERIAIAQDELALLRVAATWEQRRAGRIDALLVGVLGALRGVSIEPALLKGMALAHMAYPKPSLRHCHDIDLLVPERQHNAAADAVADLGFSKKETEDLDDRKLVLIHKDGLPVSIHADLYPGNTHRTSVVEPRMIRTQLAGVSALTLAPGELLLFMASQLLAGRVRDRTSWVADAVFLLRVTKADDIDWRGLTDQARDRGLALVLLAMLAYLNAEFETAIPGPALAYLREQARETAVARDRLLFLLRQNPDIRTGAMFQYSGWRSRLDIARWIAVPTKAYMQNWCREKGLRWPLAWYALRPLRRLSIRIRALAGAARATTGNEELR